MLEWFRFNLPIVRGVVRPADLARTTRTLGLLLAAGVPPVDPSHSAVPLPAAAMAGRPDDLLPMLSISELRRQCRVRGVEYSISETSAQLVEKLAAASPAA